MTSLTTRDWHQSTALLPGWFTTYQIDGRGCHGLMLSNGKVLAIDSIEHVEKAANGSIWLTVKVSAELHGDVAAEWPWDAFITSPDFNPMKAMVNAAHVVMAIELVDQDAWGRLKDHIRGSDDAAEQSEGVQAEKPPARASKASGRGKATPKRRSSRPRAVSGRSAGLGKRKKLS